jgi:hypothetical protein
VRAVLRQRVLIQLGLYILLMEIAGIIGMPVSLNIMLILELDKSLQGAQLLEVVLTAR